MFEFSSAEFWLAVGEITLLDVLLGGDNAVVIALACRHLPASQRLRGVMWGTGAAVALRVVLIVFAMQLLELPYLKLVGGLLLTGIGIKLMLPHADHTHQEVNASDKLWVAVKTIVLADLVMSVDNVMAVAGAAQAAQTSSPNVLVVLGLLISVPIIVWGSQLVLKAMEAFPALVSLGAMLLGWIAGEMISAEPVLQQWLGVWMWPHALAGSLALVVLGLGWWLGHRQLGRT